MKNILINIAVSIIAMIGVFSIEYFSGATFTQSIIETAGTFAMLLAFGLSWFYLRGNKLAIFLSSIIVLLVLGYALLLVTQPDHIAEYASFYQWVVAAEWFTKPVSNFIIVCAVTVLLFSFGKASSASRT